jgi:Tol biopolymer transport system component
MLLVVSTAGAAFPGENGRIVFATEVDGNTDLVTVDSDGGDRRRLTDWPRIDFRGEWSPDGRRIAFTRRVGDESAIRGEDHDELFVMNADGSGVVRLTDNRGTDWGPSWSPDGRRLVYVGGLQLMTIPASGGPVSRLTCGPDSLAFEPAWSPDGRWIAYRRVPIRGQGTVGISLISPDGREWREVTTGDDHRPDWSPDGTRILFVRDGSLMAVAVSGGAPTLLTTEPGEVGDGAWSPDGRLVLFSRRARQPDAPWDLFELKLATGEVRQVTHDSAFESGADWQPVPRAAGTPSVPSAPSETECDRRARPSPPPPAQPAATGIKVADVRFTPRRPRAGRPFTVRLALRDRLGAPVANAVVTLRRVDRAGLARPVARKTADAQGVVSFRLRARRPGRLVLSVRALRTDEAAEARRLISVRVFRRAR